MKYNKVKLAGASVMGDLNEKLLSSQLVALNPRKILFNNFGMPERSYGALGSIRMPRKG